MSEFRQDPVSGDWILMAPERSLRPSDFVKKQESRKPSPHSTCPFEPQFLEKAPNWPPLISSPRLRNWWVVVVPNRFPALTHTQVMCSENIDVGPYAGRTGIGHHDLIVTRDHHKNLALMTAGEGNELIQVLVKRYRELVEDPCILYTSAFFNWGPKAGASIYHPHYQILSLPIIPPDIQHSLNGSERYHRKRKRCVHCEMVRYERRIGKRVIFENEEAIVLAPFVSRKPYEVRLFPKRHFPFFEKTPNEVLGQTTSLLQRILKRIRTKLRDPDLNFFVHTAPLKKQERYGYYHWHIEIIPQTSISAGFELSTGVDINTVDPDIVASFLRPTR